MAQRVEAWWWRRYLASREPRAYLAWKQGYWSSLLNDLAIEIRPQSRVLDAGCGPAGIFIALATHRVTAIDPLLSTYDRLPHFKRSDYPRVAFRQTTLERFEAVAMFDFAFCLNVINHVRDLHAALRVLAKAVVPGGTIVLSVDAHRHALLRSIFSAVPGDVLHPHQLTLAEYVSACEVAGLRVLRQRRLQRATLFDYVALVCQSTLVSQTPKYSRR